ncbi:GNAT family N-acetyltransferase [Streptomyces sp. NBC_00989]|uniref:GNAT family N-acetyltransferase n=1 Tax=Streptomyces sp. NBC_00989 TaxID=2903705 RepID=UPI003865725B|nr:GNAT family N-acetyltransferase [Streptomyces sp. NBC_00989]
MTEPETKTETQTLLAAYDEQLRATPPIPPAGVTYEEDGPLLRTVGQGRGFVSGARDLGVYGAELDALIVRQQDFFAARGEVMEWRTRAHDIPADVPDRLRAAGFVAEEPATVLIARAAELAVGEPVLPEGVTVRRVSAEADLRRLGALQSAVWGGDLDWLATDLLGRIAAAPDEMAVYVVEAAGEMVCTAWLAFRPGTEFASLLGGSTLAAWRGKGIYRALVTTRAALAAARGVPYLHVDASDDSAPILRRLGFHAVTTTTRYVWSPGRADQPDQPDQVSVRPK